MPALQCPECDARYAVPDHVLGKKLKCKKCGRVFRLQPASPAPTEVPAEFSGVGELLGEVLADSSNSAPSGGGAARQCPHCRSNLDSAVICINCGYNVATGKQLTTSIASFKRNWHLGFLPLAGLGCFYTLTLRKDPGRTATLTKTRRMFFLPVHRSEFVLDKRKSLEIGYGTRTSREFWCLIFLLFGCGVIPGLIFLPLYARAFTKEDVFIIDLVEGRGRRTNLFRGRQDKIMRDLADTLSEVGQLPIERA